MAGILSTEKPWNLVAQGYTTEVKPTFELWAQDAIDRLNPQKSDLVIDIACGPGTVSLLLADSVKQVNGYDFSPKMIEQFQNEINEKEIENISVEFCDCQKLSNKNDTFDLAISQFGLLFFPDRAAGFSEMYRVLKPGGKGAVYSWAPIEESTAMAMMMGALQAGFPQPKADTAETVELDGLDSDDVFIREMSSVGFRYVTLERIRHSFPVSSPEAFWKSMVKGSAPITLMKASVDEASWKIGEEKALKYLRENLGSEELYSTAILGIGTKGE